MLPPFIFIFRFGFTFAFFSFHQFFIGVHLVYSDCEEVDISSTVMQDIALTSTSFR